MRRTHLRDAASDSRGLPAAGFVQFTVKYVDIYLELSSLLPQELVSYGLDRAQSPYGRCSALLFGSAVLRSISFRPK